MDDPIKKIVEEPARLVDSAVKEIEKLPSQKPVRVVQKYWGSLGPGLTTGASDDDPSGIATYSQAGAQFKFGFLWLALFTTPMMIVVQEICARIGLVTGKGISSVVKSQYPRSVLYLTVFLLFAANTFNIGADIAAMAEATKLILNLPIWLLAIFFTFLSIILQVYISYHHYAKFLKILTLALIAYAITALLLEVKWSEVFFHLVVPSFTLTKDSILMITAILGTTISPYLFYWQASQEVEQKKENNHKTALAGTNKKEISVMRRDVATGMLFSNLAMFFIIVVTGTVLFSQGLTIKTAADAAEALRPLAGSYAFLLFTVGIIGVGLLGIPVLAGSASYAISETFNLKEGLNRKVNKAYGFYGVIIIAMFIGLIINFIGVDPIKALILAAVINGLVAPFILTIIIAIGNNRQIMGDWKNGPLINTIGWITTVFMYLCGLATIVSLFI